MIIMQPLYQYGWPVYLRPVVYDHYDGTPQTPPTPSWRSIAIEVCQKHDVSLNDLISPRRDRVVVAARHEAFWRCKNETTMSLPRIGQRFGGRDHSTVIWGIKQHERRMMEAARG